MRDSCRPGGENISKEADNPIDKNGFSEKE